ncbi:tryptophan-rich sensory protein [Saccharothrix violaceirubra]|uniref:Tryptophan-rich sensory protein n=1 Tax=Saccharothrix violaceirubra TaxID=413306 RepID=A0A7W7WX93_9PSEU|nr:tryptophan-rich sensory protein [Saccharothrix violaceirubra]
MIGQRSRPVLGLVAFAAAVGVTALIGALAATSAGERYESLTLPDFAPPAWLFGPVWTVLYVLIALSGWLVWQRHGLVWEHVVYGVQLVLNAAWTPLFFGAGKLGFAFVDIVALLVVIALLLALFVRRHLVAGLLLVPYLLWVGFATMLNATIVVLA